jgi:cell division protein FtsL
MKHIDFNIYFTILIFTCIPSLFGQLPADSVLLQRNQLFIDFNNAEDSMNTLTRNNLMILNGKARNLVEMDNAIINQYLYYEIENNKILTHKVEQLTLEITLLQKEAEVNRQLADERKYFMKTLLITSAVVGLLLIVAVILFIDRQIRFRSIKLELERTWPLKEERRKDDLSQREINELNNKIEEQKSKNLALTSQIEELNRSIKEKEESLVKEQSSKKQIEEEIRKLISQIKNQ